MLQPWASLIVMGLKTVETRSWMVSHRGRLLIHASMGKGGQAIAALPSIRRHLPDFGALPFGAIIGEVSLVDIVQPALLTGPERRELRLASFEEDAFGRPEDAAYAWILEDAQVYKEPVPARGWPGLWTWE